MKTEENKFNKEDIDFYIPDNKIVKGLNKKYIIDCIFNRNIQENWTPQLGDIIVGCTGNIFVISGVENLHKDLGGKKYYFGGSSCNRDGGMVLDSTHCYTANESGDYVHPIRGKEDNFYHSSIRKFRYVPYPHEIN